MAQYYELIYNVIITLLTIALIINYKPQNGYFVKEESGTNKSLLLCLFMIIFIGTRPMSDLFGDMGFYYKVIEQRLYRLPLYTPNVENLIFDNFLNCWAYSGWPATLFFILIATIYFGGIYIACRRLFPNNVYLSFLTYLAAFSTFSYGVNGIKAGAAASIFLIALSFRHRLVFCIPLILLSWGMHHSMSMLVASFIVVLIWNRPKWYFVFWIFCLIIAATHVTYFQDKLEGLADEKGAAYLATNGMDWEGKKGFRLDFILYSFMPMLIGYFAIYKLKIKNSTYNFILCLYLLCNGIWMLCMYVNYNNRIAYLSWFLYPILLIMPALDPKWIAKRYWPVSRIVFLQLLFLIFMYFVYQ